MILFKRNTIDLPPPKNQRAKILSLLILDDYHNKNGLGLSLKSLNKALGVSNVTAVIHYLRWYEKVIIRTNWHGIKNKGKQKRYATYRLEMLRSDALEIYNKINI